MKRLFLLCLLLSGCTFGKKSLGTSENPIKFNIIPALDAQVLTENSVKLKDYLEKNTPYKFQVVIPESYAANLYALKENKADVACINTRGYFLAHKLYDVEARLTVIRNGLATYQSQFIVRTDSKINSVKDLHGKKIAFVDPDSTSGYLLPMKVLKDKKIIPKHKLFAKNHEAVVKMVYQNEADAGATYFNPPQDGQIEDARRLIQPQFPDVEKKIRILELSEPIPNDPIVFKRDIPEVMKEKIIETLIKFVSSSDGKFVMSQILGATNLKRAQDLDYESVREVFYLDDLKK